MKTTSRWVYAYTRDMGRICFRTSDSVGDDAVSAEKLCAIHVEQTQAGFKVEVSKMLDYELDLLKDPVTIPATSILVACAAQKPLIERCEEAWRTVQPASAAHLTRLNGGLGR